MLANFLTSGFANNLLAGAILTAIELIIIYVFVRELLRRLEHEKWKATRRLLAYRLLANTHRVAKHVRWIVAKPKNLPNLMFYRNIFARLQQLDTALQNFTTESLMHLPALEPEIAEELSLLTTRVSNLEETVLVLGRYLNDSQGQMPSFDEMEPEKAWVDPDHFTPAENKKKNPYLRHVNLVLSPRGEVSVENFIFLEVTQCIERFVEVVSDVLPIIEGYSEEWDSEYFNEFNTRGFRRKDSAETKLQEVKSMRDDLVEVHGQLLQSGFHVVLLDADYSREAEQYFTNRVPPDHGE